MQNFSHQLFDGDQYNGFFIDELHVLTGKVVQKLKDRT